MEISAAQLTVAKLDAPIFLQYGEDELANQLAFKLFDKDLKRELLPNSIHKSELEKNPKVFLIGTEEAFNVLPMSIQCRIYKIEANKLFKKYI